MMKWVKWIQFILMIAISTGFVEFTARPAQSYIIQIYQQNYLCTAEAHTTFFYPQYEINQESVGDLNAFASTPGYAVASSYIQKFQNNQNPWASGISFGGSGVGQSWLEQENSAVSTARGTIEFIVAKEAGNMEDTVEIPFFISGSLNSGGNPGMTITLNDRNWFIEREHYTSEYDISFKVGVPNTLDFLYYCSASAYLGDSAIYKQDFSIGFAISAVEMEPPGTSPVPLPGTILLLGTGIGCLAIYRCRKMRDKD